MEDRRHESHDVTPQERVQPRPLGASGTGDRNQYWEEKNSLYSVVQLSTRNANSSPNRPPIGANNLAHQCSKKTHRSLHRPGTTPTKPHETKHAIT